MVGVSQAQVCRERRGSPYIKSFALLMQTCRYIRLLLALLPSASPAACWPVDFGRLSSVIKRFGGDNGAVVDIYSDARCISYPQEDQKSSLVTLVCNVAENTPVKLTFSSSNYGQDGPSRDKEWSIDVYKIEKGEKNAVKSVSADPGDVIQLSICMTLFSKGHSDEAKNENEVCKDITIHLFRAEVMPQSDLYYKLVSFIKGLTNGLISANKTSGIDKASPESKKFTNAVRKGSGSSRIYNLSVGGNGELMAPFDPHSSSISVKVKDSTKKGDPIFLNVDANSTGNEDIEYELDGKKLGHAPFRATIDLEGEYTHHLLTSFNSRSGKRSFMLIKVFAESFKELVILSSDDKVLFSKPVTQETENEPSINLTSVKICTDHNDFLVHTHSKESFGTVNIEVCRGNVCVNGWKIKCKRYKVIAGNARINVAYSGEKYKVKLLQGDLKSFKIWDIGMMVNMLLLGLLRVNLVYTFLITGPIGPLSAMITLTIFELMNRRKSGEAHWDFLEWWTMDYFQILVDSSAGKVFHSSLTVVDFFLSSITVILLTLVYAILLLVIIATRYMLLMKVSCYNPFVRFTNFVETTLDNFMDYIDTYMMDNIEFIAIYIFVTIIIQAIDVFVDIEKIYIMGYSSSPTTFCIAIILIKVLPMITILALRYTNTLLKNKGTYSPLGSTYYILQNGGNEDSLSKASSVYNNGNILALDEGYFVEYENIKVTGECANLSRMNHRQRIRIKNIYSNKMAESGRTFDNLWFYSKRIVIKYLEYGMKASRSIAKLSTLELKQASLMEDNLEVFVPYSREKHDNLKIITGKIDKKEKRMAVNLTIIEHAVLLFTVVLSHNGPNFSLYTMLIYASSFLMWIIVAIKAQNKTDYKSYGRLLNGCTSGRIQVGLFARFTVILAAKRLISAIAFIMSSIYMRYWIKRMVVLIMVHKIVNSSFLYSLFLCMYGWMKSLFKAIGLIFLEIFAFFKFFGVKIRIWYDSHIGKTMNALPCKIIRLYAFDANGLKYEVDMKFLDKRIYIFGSSIKYRDCREAALHVYPESRLSSEDVCGYNYMIVATVILRRNFCRDIHLPLFLSVPSLESVTAHNNDDLYSVTIDSKENKLCFTGPFIVANKRYIVTRWKVGGNNLSKGIKITTSALCTSVGELTFFMEKPADFSKLIIVKRDDEKKILRYPPRTFVDFDECSKLVTVYHSDLKVGVNYSVEYTTISQGDQDFKSDVIAEKPWELHVPAGSKGFSPFYNYKVTRDDGVSRSIRLVDEVSEHYKFGFTFSRIILDGKIDFIDPTHGVCSFEDGTFMIELDEASASIKMPMKPAIYIKDESCAEILESGSIELVDSYTDITGTTSKSSSMDYVRASGERKIFEIETSLSKFLLTNGNHSMLPITVLSRLKCKATGDEYFRVIPHYNYFARVIKTRIIKLECMYANLGDGSDIDAYLAYFMSEEEKMAIMDSLPRSDIVEILGVMIRFCLSHLSSVVEILKNFDEVSRSEEMRKLVKEMDRVATVEPVHATLEHIKRLIASDYEGNDVYKDHIDHIVVHKESIRPVIHIKSQVSEWMARSSHLLLQTFDKEASASFLEQVLSDELFWGISCESLACKDSRNDVKNRKARHQDIREIILGGPSSAQDPLEGKHTFGFMRFEGKDGDLWVPCVIYLSISVLQMRLTSRVYIAQLTHLAGDFGSRHIEGNIQVKIKAIKSRVAGQPVQVLLSHERVVAPLLTAFELQDPSHSEEHWLTDLKRLEIRPKRQEGRRCGRSAYTPSDPLEFRHGAT
ncbi:hypothetical protein BEWA_003810 [Theileria equi strain WA]|uniref:Uncharacterized protein n=1 Tax=Theileria equi strain WA TaxID=1537102 RepID=L0B0F9_THEEQ|nr:hypothetical protein BEWA_003810 [Theileria equi strain WA]AFZ80973.1 hypothetical protein BEWA_003810 [Theileria equi strain WA]|eukprot:XP_004830639.1 hypothetical protein BEWA_003810 [Theileria equi strain WA]